MRKPLGILMAVAMLLATTACARIGLHEHVFLDRDAWTSQFWTQVKATPAASGEALQPLHIEGTDVHRAIRTAIRSVCEKPDEPASSFLNTKEFSPGDFKQFFDALKEDIRGLRFAMAPGGILTPPRLLAAYLSAYFSGTFVDRNGNTYAKPTFGTTIPDATITGLATVVLEAVVDAEVLHGPPCLYYPIYYTVDKEKASFLTSGQKLPTLAKVVYQAQRGDQLDDVKYYELGQVVKSVPAATKDTVIQKVTVIQYFGGLAGAGAQTMSGLIVESIGGVNAGPPIVLWKWSFGDNKLLSNLIEVVVETLGRRLTEAAVSTALGSPDKPLPAHLKWIWIGAGPNPASAVTGAPGPSPGGQAPGTP